MSNLTTTAPSTGTTLLPTYSYTNTSTPRTTPISSTRITTTTAANGDVETITDITVIQPTDASGSSSSVAPAGPTESGNAGVRVAGTTSVGLGGWIVALLAVGVGMGFM